MVYIIAIIGWLFVVIGGFGNLPQLQILGLVLVVLSLQIRLGRVEDR
jgi:hypothetical protein